MKVYDKIDGIARSTETVTAKILEVYRGDNGVVTLQTVARTQLYAAASLPIFGKEVFFCPEETILLYSSEEKTVDNEIEALANAYLWANASIEITWPSAEELEMLTYRSKKGSKRAMGHRQPYTEVEIATING